MAVSVRSTQGELPVRVTGNIHSGFTAEFTPVSVGAHTINVDYNGYPVHVSSLIDSLPNFALMMIYLMIN